MSKSLESILSDARHRGEEMVDTARAVAALYGTPAAQIDYYMGQLLFGDPTKKSFTLDDTRKYCCAELGMTIYDFQSKSLDEIASLLKTAYEKKVGGKATEKPEAAAKTVAEEMQMPAA